MMEHLNYCRQLLMGATDMLRIPSLSGEERAMYSHVADLCKLSTKFILPANGILIDDAELRALDDGEGSLRLPFDVLALEFQGAPGKAISDGTKCVVFCRSMGEDAPGVQVFPASWNKANGTWRAHDEFLIESLAKTGSERGGVRISMQRATFRGTDDGILREFSRVVLAFLNAMACANVRAERSLPRKAGKKVKAALPFDTYHVLTIDVPGQAGDGAATGGHRSPREHLRRGHIRRLADGRRIWVNATVVAHGRGGGAVTKDYAVRCAA
jgi:hypothetical protein